MDDTNTVSDFRQSALPYQHSGNVPPQASPMREQQALPRRPVTPTHVHQRPAPARMPKAQAQALVHKLKRGIVIASFLSFGTFSALVMSHSLGTTIQQASAVTTTKQVATPAAAATKKTTTSATPQATPTIQKATPTSTQQGGGYGFGSSTSTSQPVSGSQTS
ncbi:MAG: hypothetical protein PVSMB2_28690 [Ktedonobacteraceae bacterium]